MPPQHKLRHSAGAEELNKKADEIGERIRVLMREAGFHTHEEFGAAIGKSGNAVTKMLFGDSTMQYAKLALMAPTLGTDPNDILGFAKGMPREVFSGVLQGVAQALGKTEEEAQQIAAIALRVTDRRASGTNPGEAARSVVEYMIREQFDSKRK